MLGIFLLGVLDSGGLLGSRMEVGLDKAAVLQCARSPVCAMMNSQIRHIADSFEGSTAALGLNYFSISSSIYFHRHARSQFDRRFPPAGGILDAA